jgi:hypothetical protein
MGSFVPFPKAAGERQDLDGFFTTARYLRGVPPAQIELRLGYRAGRLRLGFWLMFLTRKPTAAEFEFRAYSHMSGGIEEGHKPENANNPTAEDRLRQGGYDLARLKERIIRETFQLAGPDRLAKVRPIAPAHGEKDVPDYPQGRGVPQWTLTVPLPWVAVAFVAPGATYTGMYGDPAAQPLQAR